MALSARRFIHENTCPEPTNQINCNYHATDVNTLCDGTGSTVAIFSNTATLTEIYNDTITDNNIGEGDVCAQGMDVVFVVDYTGSMGDAIDGVKTGLSNLISTINTESGGDYRLGLVIYDGDSVSSPNYASSSYYQNIDSSQKISNANLAGSGYRFITCMEKMGTTGNSQSFEDALDVLNSATNSSTGMKMGTNLETGGQAIYEVVVNGFAGSFRSGVQKLIIVVTDTHPEYGSSWFQNTLTSEVDNAGVQVMINKEGAASATDNSTWTYLANNTQPAGATHYGLNFNGTWTTGLETSIENLCEETFTYTCDALPAGWYQETGQHTAFYWNGSTWTDAHQCQYTVTINLVDNSATTNITAIPSNNAYYSDSDTYVITGSYGTTFDITNTVYAITDYTFSDITNVTLSSPGISVFTDNGAGGSGENALLSSNEFQITGTVTQDLTVNVTITGSASQTQYSMTVDVVGLGDDGVGGSGDQLDENDQTQSPHGYNAIDTANLTPSTWTDMGSTYLAHARRHVFTGAVGSTHNFSVQFEPSPSDYTHQLTSASATYSNGASASDFSNTLSDANKTYSGTITMPSGGGQGVFYVYADVNQPNYTYTLTATDAITGASIDGAPYSQTFTGYTGDTFDFTIQLSADTDYSSFTIDETLTLSGDESSAIDYTVDNVNGRVTGTVTMPAGGGDGEVRVSGSATQTQYTYEITFVDPYTDSAAWQSITYTGAVDSFHATTHPLSFKDGDTNYYITGVSNDDDTNLISSDNEDSNQSLNIVLATMPSGGGSATVTVTGSQAAVQYTFNTTFTFEPNSLPASNFTSTDNANDLSIATTGAAGSTHTVQTYIETPIDYEWTQTPSVSESHASLSNPTCAIQAGTGSTSALVSVTLEIPSGGGSGTVTIAPTVREKSYSYTLTVQTNGSSSTANQYSEALATAQGDVSGSNNGDGTVTITYGPMNAGDSVNDVLVGVIANNATDYTPEITGFGYSVGLDASLTPTENNYGSGSEGMVLDFTMHSQDPRGSGLPAGTLTANVSLTAVTHSFIISFADTIANVGPDASSQTLTGTVGEDIDWSQTYSADAGYTFSITSVSDDSASVSSVVIPGGQGVSGSLNMPSGGGSATVTAAGSSTLTTYNYVITWDNNISGADWAVNNTDIYTQTLSMAPGTTTTISQTIDPDSGREITSLTVSDNSSDVTITSSSAASGIVQARVSMPSNATGNKAATITTEGATAIIIRTLTINYSESIANARITSSTSSSASELSSEGVQGVPGATGSLTRYLMANSGYTEPVINTITDNSSYITNLASASSTGGSGLYRSFDFDYSIPSSNQSGTITIGGSVSTDCAECSFSVGSTAPTTYNGSDGVISVAYPDGSCNEPLTWGVSPSAGPQGIGMLGPQWTNASPGTYTVTVTDSFGCDTQVLVVVPNATTTSTTQSSSYNYYRAIGCDTGAIYILRSTTNWLIGMSVSTSKSGDDNEMCIDRESASTDYDYSIIGMGICECDGPAP